MHPDGGHPAIGPSQADQPERVSASDPQRPDRHHPTPAGRHRIVNGGVLTGPKPQQRNRHRFPTTPIGGDKVGGSKPAGVPHGERHPSRFTPGNPVGVGNPFDAEPRPPERKDNPTDDRDKRRSPEKSKIRIPEAEPHDEQRNRTARQPDPAPGHATTPKPS
ncbi:hypothetical protein Adu01nite_54400 [Paractinoplanes durhamensis]|uniref:Uncharacterized protein n=1 Tax=Paractinoplanes durhamensis TaxID=113563 RepID=A0ABQ3Z2R9_9ACTN|nr:hypothetical protein Adu01nite_54400 [Actinoplanes durhamensis]